MYRVSQNFVNTNGLFSPADRHTPWVNISVNIILNKPVYLAYCRGATLEGFQNVCKVQYKQISKTVSVRKH
jgi:hypothetical protein